MRKHAFSFMIFAFCYLDLIKCILQTLIYFYDPIELEQDQLIEGSVTLTQSKENARFMNIHLEYTWVWKIFFHHNTPLGSFVMDSDYIPFHCSSGNRSYVKESVMRWSLVFLHCHLNRHRRNIMGLLHIPLCWLRFSNRSELRYNCLVHENY